MPAKRAGKSVTCADCYFRQEMLCTLNTTSVCPTFRATVGGEPVPPRQPQLVTLAPIEHGASLPASAAQVAVVDKLNAASELGEQAPEEKTPAHSTSPSLEVLRDALKQRMEQTADGDSGDVVLGQERSFGRPTPTRTVLAGRIANRVGQRYPNAMARQ